MATDGLPHRMQVRAVELWLRDSDVAAEMGRRLQEAGLTRTWSMLQEQVLLPMTNPHII